MTMPAGLLDQSAIQRLLASMQGGTQHTVQAPNLGGLMAPQIQPTPGFNPQAPDPTAHVERGGIRGGILHALGADKVAPELGALLTPDQRERVKPGLMATIGNAVIRGKTPAQVQQERALNMLGLQDAKKSRDKQARDEAMWEQIQGVAAQIPDPQARLEYTARMASSMGLAQGDPASLAAQRLEPPVRAPIQEQFSNAQPMVIEGKTVMAQIGNLGTVRIVPGATPPPAREADDNTIVAIDDGSGNPVYVPRAEAIGKRPWQAPTRPTISTARVQETYRRKSAALDDLNKAIDVYRQQLSSTGVEVMPGPARSRLTGAYANLKLLAKEAANLGALTGPDVKILEELFNDPASLRSAGMNILEGGNRKQSLLEQLDQYRAIINGQRRTLEENYSREMEMAGPSGAPTPPQTLRKTTLPKPANATDAEWAAFLLTRGEKP